MDVFEMQAWWSLCASIRTLSGMVNGFARWHGMPRRAERLERKRLLGNGNSGSVKQEATELIAAYKDHEPVHRLVQRFGIHRVTVTATLRRHGVELRRTGLAPDELPAAARLYGEG
jgi:hypothetical protein